MQGLMDFYIIMAVLGVLVLIFAIWVNTDSGQKQIYKNEQEWQKRIRRFDSD